MTPKQIVALITWLEREGYKLADRKFWHIGRSNQYITTVQKDITYYRCIIYRLEEDEDDDKFNIEILQIVNTGLNVCGKK